MLPGVSPKTMRRPYTFTQRRSCDGRRRDSPARKRFRREIAEDVCNQERDDPETHAGVRILFRAGLNVFPEGNVFPSAQHMATKFEKVGRPRKFAADVFVCV